MRAKALAGGLTYLFLSILAVGCGDDEGGSDGGAGEGGAGAGGTGGDGTGGRPMLPSGGMGGTGGGSGDGGVVMGDGEEGFPCLTVADCGKAPDGAQLACVESGFANFGVCARSCASDDDCGEETCVSISGQAADAHCINLINEEFALCGVIETSTCAPEAGLTCLYLPDQPYGVCTTLCVSGGDDGGVADGTCDADQFCRGNIVSSTAEDPRDGVCGVHAARGEECGIFLGSFCNEGDLCAPENPADIENTPFVCRQDCTESPDVCAEGTTCTMFQGSFFCQ